MPIVPRIAELHDLLTGWRRDLHAHPQTAFEETYASDFIAAQLQEFGLQVRRGLAKTGVVGTLDGLRTCASSFSFSRVVGMVAHQRPVLLGQRSELLWWRYWSPSRRKKGGRFSRSPEPQQLNFDCASENFS